MSVLVATIVRIENTQYRNTVIDARLFTQMMFVTSLWKLKVLDIGHFWNSHVDARLL